MAQITAVNVVHEVRPDAHNAGGRTAIDKRAVAGAVALGALGLEGDQQMDVEHHGGRLWLDTGAREGPGAVFRWTLPATAGTDGRETRTIDDAAVRG